MPFTRVLIANRGEIAVRIIRTCRELGISPLAIYSTADAGALHVRLSDAAYCVGPAPAAESYLRSEAVIAAALAAGAEAIHPGYGFLSENATFAQACTAAGLVFVGPPPTAIEAMGQKIAARRIAAAAGVPIVPGYNGDDQDDLRLLAEAERIGFPLLIKASAGGGGKGMRTVRHAAEFADALAGARREARAAFGDDTVFLERLLLRPRHVEVQVLADRYGATVHLGERECSIQRRHQKIVEESPSPVLSPELRSAMGAAAVRAAQAVGYVNAGTVEFMLDEAGHFYFLEMNTRLQVEHPVTELVTGLDLVQIQLAIAAGQPLPFAQDEVTFRGHAIEMRVYAEDPVTFLPDTGHLALCEPPTGSGVRVDAGVTTGDAVTVHYDPLLAKLIVYAADRSSAIGRMRRALDEYAILGVTTNLPLLRAIAAHPAFAAGATHTGFLDSHPLAVAPPTHLPAEVLAAAAIWQLSPQNSNGNISSDPFAHPWRMDNQGVAFHFRWGETNSRGWASANGSGWQITLAEPHAEQPAKLHVDDVMYHTNELLITPNATTGKQDSGVKKQERLRIARDPERNEWLILWRGSSYRLAPAQPLSVDAYGRHGGSHGGASLTAPMPGTLIKVLVAAGQTVKEGQPLLILEAMKMEHTVIAPCDGVVQNLPFAEGASVTGGVLLVELEEVNA